MSFSKSSWATREFERDHLDAVESLKAMTSERDVLKGKLERAEEALEAEQAEAAKGKAAEADLAVANARIESMAYEAQRQEDKINSLEAKLAEMAEQLAKANERSANLRGLLDRRHRPADAGADNGDPDIDDIPF